MRPQSNFRIIAVMALMAGGIFFAACKKELLPPSPDTNAGNGVTTQNFIIPLVCQLTGISGNANYAWRQGIMNKIDYTDITYNSDATPARCKHSEESYDSLTSNFYYDATKRLKSITTNWYPHSHVLSDYQTDYYTFNYLANGTLLVSQYSYQGGNSVKQGVGCLLIEFDSKQRVAKQSRTVGALDGSGLLTGYLRYAYGTDGNLSDVYSWALGATEVPYYHFNTYDTKRNFCTTNSEWQLLLDQYSLNNPTNFIYGWSMENNDFMVYDYSAQNEPSLAYHWDGIDKYWTANPIGYSCKSILLP
jgi:hypothetical protein